MCRRLRRRTSVGKLLTLQKIPLLLIQVSWQWSAVKNWAKIYAILWSQNFVGQLKTSSDRWIVYLCLYNLMIHKLWIMNTTVPTKLDPKSHFESQFGFILNSSFGSPNKLRKMLALTFPNNFRKCLFRLFFDFKSF